MAKRVVLAYSGGLDTSVAVKWINETYGLDVIAYTCDLGQGQDIQAIRDKALRTGAVEAIAEDVRNLFVDYFAFPSLMAGDAKVRSPISLWATRSKVESRSGSRPMPRWKQRSPSICAAVSPLRTVPGGAIARKAAARTSTWR